MADRNSTVVAVMLAALVAALAILLAIPTTPTAVDAEPEASAPSARPDDRKAAPRAHAAAAKAVVAEAAPALPAPVDLAAADRDLDLCGVVVTGDGAPVSGAVLRTVWAPWTRAMQINFDARDFEVEGPATRSAADGTFRLRLARGQDVTLRAEAPGLATVGLAHRMAGERVRVVLEPPVRLVVRAVDEVGAGVGGVPVRVFRGDWSGDPTFRRDAVTAADGACAFDGLPRSCQAYVETRAAGRAPVSFRKVDLPAAGEATAEIVLVAGRTLRGSVVDAASGAPLPGARVGMGWTLDAEVATSEDGSFALPGWAGKDESEVHVVAAGHARAQRTVGTAEFVEFALDRGFETTGRIVDAAGAPVGGASVSVIASVDVGGVQRISMGDATTDAAGRFTVGDLNRALPHRLVVVAAGHARMVRKLAAAPADGALDAGDVELPASRTIEGCVVTPSGDPIARMPLELWGPDDRDYFHYGYNESRATDDLGRFRFTDLSPGGYQISTKQRGASETVEEVKLAADSDAIGVRITVDPGTPIVARVVDASGRPLSGVHVMAFGGDGMSPGASTDASGIARLTLRGNGLKLRASCSLDDQRCLLAPPMHDVVPEDREVRFVMRQGAKLAGTVVDPDGRPLAGAVVEVRPADANNGMLPADASGRFATTVERGRTYSVVFNGMIQGDRMSATAFAAAAADVAAGTTDVVLRCERVAQDRTLTVRVVRPDGTPAAGTRVFAVAANGSFPPTGAMTADGRLAFTGLPAKELSLMAWPTGDWLGPPAMLVTPAGQEIVLTMRPALPIAGTVVRADGSPVKGAHVRVFTGPTMHQGNDSKDDGAFRLLVPADDPGPLRVEVQFSSGGKPTSAVVKDVVPGTDSLRVVL